MTRNSSIHLALLAVALPCIGCGETTSEAGAPASGGVGGVAYVGGSDGGGTGGTGGGINIGGAAGSAGVGGDPIVVPVRSLPGLESMTFFERTGGAMPTAYTFAVDGPELTTRLADPLSEGHDISGANTEYYDVYYSDDKGEPDIDGSFLTISGVFEMSAPYGGGLNLSEISLNFAGKPSEFGNWVASWVALGDNQDAASVEKCIDGDLQTETSMGNTLGSTDRLRLTLGFLSSSGPPPPIK